jgi:lactoylglutathione lyase
VFIGLNKNKSLIMKIWHFRQSIILILQDQKINIMPKIEHVAIYCQNLETMKAFYEKYFGAMAGSKYENLNKGFESYFLSFEDGSRLELMAKTSVTESHKPNEYLGFTHLAFSVGSKENVDSLTQRLSGDGYNVIGQARTTGDGYYESVILDPEKNRIEITI